MLSSEEVADRALLHGPYLVLRYMENLKIEVQRAIWAQADPDR